jgi:hypothetical protein
MIDGGFHNINNMATPRTLGLMVQLKKHWS